MRNLQYLCNLELRSWRTNVTVSGIGITHFVKGSLITSLPMTNRLWVTLPILWKVVSSHLFLWPTGGVWNCTFFEWQSHHIFSYDQQVVSEISPFVKGSLITSFPTTNRLWVTLHILWKGSLITSFPMTNSKWVALHILWKEVSSHLFLWFTVCEWHCTFCERQSHYIFSYDQQGVSDIAHSVKGSLTITSFPMTNSEWVALHNCERKPHWPHLFLWPTVCEWHCMFCKRAVSSHLFLWPIGCEWHCKFCERQSHHIFSYDQQDVSDIAHFVKGSLITSLPMTNRLWVTLQIF